MGKILEGLKILLVEEEVLIAMDVEHICYDHGAARVMTISSEAKLAPETSEVAAALQEVDVAILDVKIGEGWTTPLARRLADRGIPFIFATGYAGTEPFFADFPGIGVVTKPYSVEEIVEALALAALTRRQPSSLPEPRSDQDQNRPRR